jgi:tetratricopeptide (TPR) repeat protein
VPGQGGAAISFGFTDGRCLPVLVVVPTPVLRAGPASGHPDEAPSHLPVDSWAEWRRIREAVDRARDPYTGGRPALKLHRLLPPTLARLREALHAGPASGRPARPAYPMVHLIGCVLEDGLLRMEQENGREDPTAPESLAAAFQGAGVEIALLTICDGEEFAAALIRDAGVRAALTTRGRISEAEANLLAREIYLRLAYGDSAGEALAYAQQTIREAYRRREIPPLDDWDGLFLDQYADERADAIILTGDPDARLPILASWGTQGAADPDLAEPANNLPHPDDHFFGRGAELVLISGWMAERGCRIIALTGIGGIGKSSLAQAAAQRNSWRFKAVIYLTAKDAVGPRALTIHDICRQVDVVLGLGGALSNLPSRDARCQRAAEVLNEHPCLLVLDNLEVLTPQENSQLADFLLRLDPRFGSMALLTLRPEHLPPLVSRTAGELYHLPVESLRPADAVALLAELLQPSRSDPAADEGAAWDKVPSRAVAACDRARLEERASRTDAPRDRVASLVELAEAAHHHPFLLRFAAAALREPGTSWTMVRRRLEGLGGEDLQTKVEDMIGQMCETLGRRTPQALSLIQALLVFSGGAAPEPLQRVWCGAPVAEDAPQDEAFSDACRAAHRASLLDFRAGRYDLHPLVRQYLGHRRPPNPEQLRDWARFHADWCLDYARRNRRDHDSLERERLNLFAAMGRADQEGRHAMVVELGRLLFDFLWVRGYWSEGRRRMVQALAAARALQDPIQEAHLLYQLAVLCRAQGDYEEARRHCESVVASEAASGTALMGRTLHELGILHRYQGNYDGARAYYEKSLKLARELEEPALEAKSLHELGVVCGLQGDAAAERRYANKALAFAEVLGDKALKANTLHRLGVSSWVEGAYDEARRQCEASLVIARELVDLALMARTLHDLGVSRAKLGDYEGAQRNYEESQALREQLGDKSGLASTLYSLAELEWSRGEINAAEGLHRRSLELAEQVENPFWQAMNLYGLGLCLRARGRRAAAGRMFRKALAIAHRLGIPLAEQARAALDRCG